MSLRFWRATSFQRANDELVLSHFQIEDFSQSIALRSAQLLTRHNSTLLSKRDVGLPFAEQRPVWQVPPIWIPRLRKVSPVRFNEIGELEISIVEVPVEVSHLRIIAK